MILAQIGVSTCTILLIWNGHGDNTRRGGFPTAIHRRQRKPFSTCHRFIGDVYNYERRRHV